MADQILTKTENGPRTVFGNDGGVTYLVVGAYDNLNHIDSKDRVLVVHMAKGMQLLGLTTAPAGTPTNDLCVDAKGNIYRQS